MIGSVLPMPVAAEDPQQEGFDPFITAFTACPYRSLTVSRTASFTVSARAFLVVLVPPQQLGPQQDFSAFSVGTVGFAMVVSWTGRLLPKQSNLAGKKRGSAAVALAPALAAVLPDVVRQGRAGRRSRRRRSGTSPRSGSS